MLSKKEILEVQDIQKVEVPVPEWGGAVYVKAMTGVERESWESSLYPGGKKDLRHIREKLLVRTLVDETGERIFGDKDVDALSQKNGIILNRLFEKAQEINGLRNEDVEERSKNSESAESEDSISSSPASSE